MKSFLFGCRARLSEANVPCGLEPRVTGSRSERDTAQREGMASEAAQRQGKKMFGHLIEGGDMRGAEPKLKFLWD